MEGGGLLHPLDTGYHLGESALFKFSTKSNLMFKSWKVAVLTTIHC